MRYWVAYRECGCVLAVVPETASMIPQGADCEFVRQAVARGLKTRLTAEGEHVDIPSQGAYIACPEHAAIWPALNPLEEKPGKEAAETKGASPEAGVEYEVKYFWPRSTDSGTLEELDQRIANGDLVIASQEEYWTYPLIAPPSGAGESERRGMADKKKRERRQRGECRAVTLSCGRVEVCVTGSILEMNRDDRDLVLALMDCLKAYETRPRNMQGSPPAHNMSLPVNQ